MRVMPKGERGYMKELELVMKCLDKTPEETLKYLRRWNRARLAGTVEMYRKPEARVKLMELYQKVKWKVMEKEEARTRRVQEEMEDEKAIETARRFLQRCQGDEVIPGFEGFGGAAGSGMLQALSEEAVGEREVPVVADAGGDGKPGVRSSRKKVGGK